jgi:membrane-bound lytic murein transglycosylase D
MGKLISIFLIFSISPAIFAISFDNYFQNDILLIEGLDNEVKEIIKNKKIILPTPKDSEYNNLVNIYNKNNTSFPMSDYFKYRAKFWFDIYTKYNVLQKVIHDKVHLRLVYNVIDMNSLFANGTSFLKLNALYFQVVEHQVQKIRDTLHTLKTKRSFLNSFEREVISNIKEAHLKIPNNSEKRKIFFFNLSKNLRTQTGQNLNVSRGIQNSLLYIKKMKELIKLFEVPEQLLTIPFLESSFNIKAKSKVGATGTWQFMRFIGKAYMTINKRVDHRLNPLLASLSGLQMLKQSRKILKRWDLSIMAYNSGTKHIIKAKRQLSKSNMTIEDMLKNYKHPHIGFASRNFYSSFLALSLARDNAELFFKDINKAMFKKPIHIYVSLQSMKPINFYHKLKKNYPQVEELNRHILRPYSTYPRGTIFITSAKLSERKYYRISEKYYLKKYPKNWKHLIKRK